MKSSHLLGVFSGLGECLKIALRGWGGKEMLWGVDIKGGIEGGCGKGLAGCRFVFQLELMLL